MSTTQQPFSLHLFGLEFTFKLVPTIGLVCVLPILLWLGFWQLHRADYKRQLMTEFNQRAASAPVAFKKIPSNPNTFRFYHVTLTGRYINAQQLLLDNRYHNHQLGYQVLTPFTLNSGEILLVNRGWIPLGQSRQQLPKLLPINGQQKITGTLKPIAEKVFHLGKENQTGWPRVIESLSQETLHIVFPNKKIQPMILLLAKDQPHGFTREFKVTTMPASKHMGYAVQWFALAATLFIIFLVLNTKRRKI